MGLCGSRATAEEIKERVKTFLSDHLTLPLSEEKTRLTYAQTEEAFFLGTILTSGDGGEANVVLQKTNKGKTIQRRSTGWATILKAPMEKVLKRLKERGFCTETGEPTAKGRWTSLDADQIIQRSSSVTRGLQNDDRFGDTWKQCSRIQSILTFSLAKTLAQRDNLSVPQVFRRFGKDLSVLIKGQRGTSDRQVSFSQNQDWAKKKRAFQGGDQNDRDVVRTLVRLRTRSKRGKPCCLCGEAHKQIEMHHIRHIRKRSNKRVATGFNRLVRAMNRKHVPVCSDGHRKIHRGEYDGLKLSNLADLPCETSLGVALGEPCACNGASTVRRGGVGVPRQPGPGLLPNFFRQNLTDGPIVQNLVILARGVIAAELQLWENTQRESLPQNMRRGLANIIPLLGTPARSPKPRGKAKGRFKGVKLPKRTRFPVVRAKPSMRHVVPT